MKTKTIFKTLAMALLLPAMLLTTACSSDDDDAINNNENIVNNTEQTAQKGYPLQVTVNVTREGDEAATRASYNESTKKLSFSEGDKLFVNGYVDEAGYFAGTLTWVSGETFSGTITTEKAYSGTAHELFTAASSSDYVRAELLPAGYGTYGYFSILENNVYDAEMYWDYNKTFATTKALAVEQFSDELADVYNSGFALSPQNAILNFTISGLAASTEVNVSLTVPYGPNVTGKVTTNGSGTAIFAIGVRANPYQNINTYTLTVDGKTITLPSQLPAKGYIYKISRFPDPIALSAATSDYVGSVVTTDGYVYATVAAASAASKTAVAVIAYVGTAGSVDASSASYKGLAIALSDANGGSQCQWAEDFANCLSSSQTSDITTALGFKNGISCTNTLTGDGHTHAAATAAASNNGTAAPTGTSGWFMPSMGQWNLIVQGLATKKAGTAVTTDLTYQTDNNTYKADNLNSVITDAGGTGFQKNSYWASTEQTLVRAWAIYFTNGYATNYAKTVNYYVRSVIAF